MSDRTVLVDPDEDFIYENPRGCCHPNRTYYRMIALLFMCFLGFGSYFCYDNPAALESHFEIEMNLTHAQYSNLYSWYSWPNVVCCFLGGFLIDRIFGIRLGTSIFSVIVVIGQFIFAYGAYMNSLFVMIIGRFIFGIGGESLAVAQNSYAVLWFKGKELNMVFGFQLSLARAGSTVNMYVMEPLYKYVSSHFGLEGYKTLAIVLLIGGATCVASLIFTLILGCMDKRAQRILNRRDPGETEVVRLSDCKSFPTSFWMVSLVIVAYYSSIFPFVGQAHDLFTDRFKVNDFEANKLNSIVYTISAFISPLMGILVDKTGRNLFWVFLSLVLSVVCHALIGFTLVNPYMTMILMGLAYSMLSSSLWPLIAIVIPEYQLGTAYGISQSVQNLGLAICSILAGVIVEGKRYGWMEVFFIGILSFALIMTMALWIYDHGRLGLLNMSASQRSIHDANKLATGSIERERMLNADSDDVNPQEFLDNEAASNGRNSS